MKSYNITGMQIREDKKIKAYFHIKVGEKTVTVTRGFKEFIFAREDLEKIFKEEKHL